MSSDRWTLGFDAQLHDFCRFPFFFFFFCYVPRRRRCNCVPKVLCHLPISTLSFFWEIVAAWWHRTCIPKNLCHQRPQILCHQGLVYIFYVSDSQDIPFSRSFSRFQFYLQLLGFGTVLFPIWLKSTMFHTFKDRFPSRLIDRFPSHWSQTYFPTQSNSYVFWRKWLVFL